jgi:catechol 2,3-dioxygenase-like lactoylglutathione lyase family enzyme
LRRYVANVDFYTRVLGLQFVKRTVNFDAPDTYHFYYGDSAGSPGSLLTFFAFQDAAAGRIGTGMAETTAFAIPEAALDAWMSRLAEEGLDFEGPLTRFGAQTVGFRDPDGLRIDLVAEPGLHATVVLFHRPAQLAPDPRAQAHATYGSEVTTTYAEARFVHLPIVAFARHASRKHDSTGAVRAAHSAAVEARGCERTPTPAT